MPLALALCAVALFSAPARAGELLDYLRNFDLNDYSLGLGISTAQNPYVGTGSSTYAYPYLTSFTHSAFTRDWVLLRGGNAGFRVVTESGWELGLVGRIQTLGFGDADTDELLGLREREWAAEAGPLIGWRRWPVHFQFRSYWELPNRHSGTVSELEISLPLELSRGFFVPSLKTTYQSSDYSGYYFGVTPAEASPSRLEYRPGAAMNTSLGMEIGYEVAPRWLLKSTVAVDFLDSSITDSPLVERDRLWSASVGLAYNAKLFEPRDGAGVKNDSAVEIRLGAVESRIDTRVFRDAPDGTSGDGVDLEDLLGLSDRATITQLDALFRVGVYHRFELGYFELQRSASKTLERDIEFGDQTFLAGTNVQARNSSRWLRLVYAYSLVRDGQKEAGVRAGLGYTRIETKLFTDGEEQSDRAVVEVPLPTVGIFGRLPLGSKWQLGAEADLFALEFDRVEGYMARLNVSLEREFSKHIGAGVGYTFYGTRLTANDDDLRGTLRSRYHGPRLYLSARF